MHKYLFSIIGLGTPDREVWSNPAKDEMSAHRQVFRDLTEDEKDRVSDFDCIDTKVVPVQTRTELAKALAEVVLAMSDDDLVCLAFQVHGRDVCSPAITDGALAYCERVVANSQRSLEHNPTDEVALRNLRSYTEHVEMLRAELASIAVAS